MSAKPARAAIYARFSTELQNDRSIDDQVALCRDFAARQGFSVVAVHADRARSGGAIAGRDGLRDLMEQARAGAIDAVVVEALDRLSRDMEDLAGLHKRLSFLGIGIHAVHEGTVDTVLVGLRGLIGQLYREDNAHKIRRGQEGRAKAGLSPGGLAYGYAPVAGAPGERAIVEDQAAIVRRIYAEYATGRSPREIAARLNTEGVPSPSGGRWNASTINGSRARGTGILHNPAYGGRLVWNRQRMVRDPDSGRRLGRGNGEEAWTVADRPELAIVDAEIFAAVRARLDGNGGRRPHELRKPRRILSGLLRCGACGAGMSSMGKDRSGRVRIRCSGHAERGDCPDPATFYLDTVERTVLGGLRREMRHPKAMAAWAAEYHEERRRLARGAVEARGEIERRLAAIGREADRITDWLVKGIGDVGRLDRRAKELMAEEKTLQERLAEADGPRNVVALHPAALEQYERQLEALEAALGKALEHGQADAADAIRDLVDTVTVSRGGDGVIEIEIAGRLNALLGEGAFPDRVRAVSGGTMVAEERCGRSPSRRESGIPWRLGVRAAKGEACPKTASPKTMS